MPTVGFLDLGVVPSSGPVADALTARRRMRIVTGPPEPARPWKGYHSIVLPDVYDALFWIAEVGPATLLPEPPTGR